MDNELKDLCEEVYKRTDWNGIHEACFNSSCNHHAYYDNGKMISPKYTSDYLLEKLPRFIIKEKEEYWIVLEPMTEDRWAACYGSKSKPLYDSWADTPLKALLKFVIALDDAGVKL